MDRASQQEVTYPRLIISNPYTVFNFAMDTVNSDHVISLGGI
jgi:hypothetical protein